MMGVATPKDGNWRLVCHNCEYQWPKMSAIAISKATCCEHPDIHVHNIDKPCDYCRDEPPYCDRCGQEIPEPYELDAVGDGTYECGTCKGEIERGIKPPRRNK